jgi:subtilase family serine protease
VKGPFKLVAPLIAALAVAACSAGGSSNLPISAEGAPAATHVLPGYLTGAHPACAGSRVGQAQCDALISDRGAQPDISGLTAANLEAAYNLPSKKGGKGQSVYIVDSYDNPNIASDLATYRSTMGLPKPKFNKYNQTGQKSNYPPADKGWGLEEDLDVEMVSASCPNCTINLVEADDNSWTNTEAAEAEAVKLGAKIISNSYSGTGATESGYDSKGLTYLASGGDDGYTGGLVDPATFQRVVAVGGTDLTADTGTKRGWTEVVWSRAGAGCSLTQEAKPAWQTDTGCKYRTGDDISAVAAVEVAEYDSYEYSGWFLIGGTSVSSPLVAGMYALAGNAAKQTGGENLWKAFTKLTIAKQEASTHNFYISSGSDGSCNGSYLCTAGTQQYGIYSGPSGWGTPDGVKEL